MLVSEIDYNHCMDLFEQLKKNLKNYEENRIQVKDCDRADNNTCAINQNI